MLAIKMCVGRGSVYYQITKVYSAICSISPHGIGLGICVIIFCVVSAKLGLRPSIKGGKTDKGLAL